MKDNLTFWWLCFLTLCATNARESGWLGLAAFGVGAVGSSACLLVALWGMRKR